MELFQHQPADTVIWWSLVLRVYEEMGASGRWGSETCPVQFSRSDVSDSLWPHGLQHSRLPCPSPTPKACSNSCPSSRTISSNHLILCCLLLLLPSIFPSIRVFSNESVIRMRWPKYWRFSFSISPSNEYSGLISFRMDWLDLLAVQGTLKSLLQHHHSKASSVLNLLYRPTLTSIHDYWKTIAWKWQIDSRDYIW